MKTEILKIKGDWMEVVDDCRTTVGKESLGKEPSRKFKRAILIAEHTPIRVIYIKWRWSGIPTWVATHWVRHKWEKFVQSQRSDRTGVDRNKLPQDEPVTMKGEANPQQLIDTFRKRLCYQASPETRGYAEDFKRKLHGLEQEISEALVPNCVYRCGCPEMANCPVAYWAKLVKEINGSIITTNIQERYDLYNAIFFKE